ncbi:hypothetical protein FRB95_012251 [Tulasnella sp. JGI-2019a]|nr:hypothetical protein FRB95_012251 [Tulasnella sp. JGI-2019a]
MDTEDSQSDGLCALNLPEIQLHIFAELDAHDLINVALVCKAWSWSAIDTAWRTSNFRLSWLLAPLINSTARDLRAGMDSDLLPKIAKAECMSVEQWGSWRQCMGKITYLCADLTWKVALAITKTQPVDPLHFPIFPNLLSLELDVDGPESPDEEADMERWTPLLPLLVGPRLEKLTLSFYAVTSQVVNDIIQSLVHIAPRIHTVRIINHTRAVSPDYSRFSHLRRLTVRGLIDHETWKRLASCPRLESISLRDGDQGRSIETQHYSVTFPCIKTLSINHLEARRNAEFTLALLRSAAMPALRSLEIKFPTFGDTDIEASRSELLGFMRHCLLLKDAVINGRVAQKNEHVASGIVGQHWSKVLLKDETEGKE